MYPSSLRATQVLRFWLKLALVWLGFAVGTMTAHAQTIYGVGDNTGGTVYNEIYSINPANGAATRVCPTTALSFNSVAIGVSNLQGGRIYYIEQNVVNPRINSFDPIACTNGTPVVTTLPGVIIRATACPDGRFYAMSNTAQFFEINPVTGATIRTLNWAGLTAGGSGDFGCVSNGDMYIVGVNAAGTYSLYSAAQASFQSVPNNTTVTASNVSGASTLTLVGTPNGISEAPAGGVGCAPSPNPCLVLSTGANNQTWGVNSSTGVATNRGATGATLTDLSRNFPINLGSTKTVTPTTALQGQTVTYTIDVSNAGPGVISIATVSDTFAAGAISSVGWVCSVVLAGSPTLVPTACTTATGTGNINQTVSLSIGGQVRFVATAQLSNTFTGVLSNSALATVSVGLTETDPSNNTGSVTSTVAAAADLRVTKTDEVGTLTAGQTTTYTITVGNFGPATVVDAVLTDPVSPGLSCAPIVTCSVVSGTATCPTAPISSASLQAGVLIPSMNANSTLAFNVTCGVTATGQ